MLKRLKIRNFQIHQTLTLNLDPYITTIVGESDCGKSAILRAIRWAMLNRPSGGSFIRSGADHVSVRMHADEFHIVRRRGRSENSYRLGKSTFRCLGTAGIPDAIATALNVSEVNFQSQHSPPFWFADSPGQVAKQLNTIVNLDVIDQALANLVGGLRKAKTTVEITRERLAEAKKQRDALSFVQQLDSDLCSLEEQSNTIGEIKKKRARLAAIIADVSEYENLSRNASEAVSDASTWTSLGDQLLEVQRKRQRLQELMYSMGKAEDELCHLSENLNQAKERLARRTKGKCPLCGKLLKT